MSLPKHYPAAPKVTLLQGLARSKPIIRLLMGLCLGVALSLIAAPFVEDQCASLYAKSSVERDDGQGHNDKDDFNPVIKTIPTTKEDFDGRQEQGGKQTRLVRPRYLSTELGIREKLFISVFTNAQSIETRGVAVNKTLNHLVQKVTFFMNGHASTLPQGLPIVSFSNNHSHMVPFHAIKYIADHYLNAYDWFYFFTDSTYVRGDRLTEFVQHVSVAQSLMIGKPVDTENDRVSTCDLDAGILLSQSVMVFMVQQLEWCIRNSIPDASDAENMRMCLARAAERLNITCMDVINELTYSYYTSSSLDLTTLPKNHPEVSRAIAVGTVKRAEDFYWLHRFLCEIDMKLIREQLEKVKEEIIKVAPLTPEGNKSLIWPLERVVLDEPHWQVYIVNDRLRKGIYCTFYQITNRQLKWVLKNPGVSPPSKPQNRFDLIRWDYFTETHIYYDSDFSNIRELKGVDKQDVQDIMQTSLDRLNSKYDNRFLRTRLVNGYRRFDASRGMEYILDLILTNRQTRHETFKRVQLVRPLGDVEIVPMPYVTENTRVNLLLTVHPGEKDDVLSFFDSYAHTCLESGDNTYLFVVFVYESENQERDDIYTVIKSTIAFYENRHHSRARITWISVRTGGVGGVLLSYMVLDALTHRLSPESLLLRCTVGMDLSIEFLNRVRMNTIKGWQVFFPIGYWSYKPNLIYDQHPYPTTIEINQKSGRYDARQFIHASFYMDDYLYAKRQLTSAGTLSDDIDLYGLFVQYHALHVFRAVEPALRLQFRVHECEGLSGRGQADCLDSRAHGLASRSQLGMLIFEYQQKLDQMQLNVMHQQRGENVGQMKPEMLRRK